MLLQNTRTSLGLVNSITVTAEKAILDTNVQHMYLHPFVCHVLTL